MRIRLALTSALVFVFGAVGCRDVPSAAAPDASHPSHPSGPSDAAAIDPIDGAPTRQTCTSTFRGTVMADGQYGRLDGYLVAIVQPGSSARPCNADLTHVHVQVQVQGVVYDLAVNVDDDVHSQSFDHPMFTPWAEGWHTGSDIFVDYAGLGLHSSTIPAAPPDVLVPAINTDLAAVNHISIYATGYGPDGGHLVHYNGGGADGLIITQPLSPTSHMRAFSFDSSSF